MQVQALGCWSGEWGVGKPGEWEAGKPGEWGHGKSGDWERGCPFSG